MKVKRIMSFLLVALISVQMSMSVFSAAAFSDVQEDSHWYDGISFVEERGISIGIGNDQYAPNTLITLEQWVTMLYRAFDVANSEKDAGRPVMDAGYKRGWISVEGIFHPESNMCRGALYCSAFSAFDIEIYSYELYPDGRIMTPWENCLRVGKELGLCAADASASELVTRGEAAQLLYQLMTQEFQVKEPPVLSDLPIQNKDEIPLDPYLLEIQKIPETIMDKFRQLGWKIILDFEYLAQLSEERGMTCIGATNYQAKAIYMSEASATIHEVGHFLHGVLHFPSEVKRLYQLEAETAETVLGEYSTTNEIEYFAEYFAYWIRYGDSGERMSRLEEASPETYQLFTKLEANGWLSI